MSITSAPTRPDADPPAERRANDTQSVRGRSRHVVGKAAKAAGLTAAGLVGGAVLQSRGKAVLKLPWSRRRSRAKVVLHRIGRRLP